MLPYSMNSRVRKMVRNLILVLIVTFSVAIPCLQPRAQGSDSKSVLATDLDPAVANQWMELLYDRVQADKISAPAGSRLYAYAGITLYQAVLPGIPSDNSLSGQLQDLVDMPVIDDTLTYDWPTSASSALKVVMTGLMPSADTQKAFSGLFDKQTAERSQAVGKEVVERSVEYGASVGDIMLAWANNDKFTDTRSEKWTIPSGDPSNWVETTAGAAPVEPFWGQLRPFAMEYPEQCNVKPNMKFDTDPNSTFYAQAMEVKTTRDHLTDDQKTIASFWIDTPGVTGTPAGHWVMIEDQLTAQLNLKLAKAAEMYALVGMSLADSFISCWNLKYQVNLMRPVSYINQYISRSWSPFVQTPSFPEYPSGHSVASEAAANTLTAMFGTVAFKDASHLKYNLPVRFYTSFEQAAQEAGISRLYGGIHYRQAIENGFKQGRCVSQQLLSKIQLRPTPQGE